MSFKKCLFFFSLGGFILFPLKFIQAEETITSYGPYSYGQEYDETISIPTSSRVYIGELQTDAAYSGNYLSHSGFFVGGWAGYLQINDITAMYEEHAFIEDTGYVYTTYYWKSVYEDSSRYREASTDSSFGTGITYYLENTTLTDDRRWMDITDLVNLGQDNTFSFYHFTDSDQGYVVKIVSEEGEEITYNTDFVSSEEGFSFDNFATSVDEELIRDFFHIYNYNLLYYSDWRGNYYWKWDVDRIIESFKPGEEDGKCFGFNFSAWDFYNGYDEVGNYQTTAGVAYDLEQTSSVEDKIKGSFYYQMAQEFSDYYDTHQEAGDYTISSVYSVIKDYFSSEAKADFMLGVFSAAEGGHALTPYRLVESADANTAYLYVYDSNYQGQEKVITFNNLNSDVLAPRWRYLPDYDSDNGDTMYYYFLPNIYDGTVPTLPGQKKSKMILNSLGDEVNVLITDGQGNNLGYDSSGNFYNDIPDAYPQWNLQAGGKVSGFVLPKDKTYTVTIADASDFQIYLTDKNKSLEVSGTKSSDSDYITIDGNELSFTTYEGAEIDLTTTKKSGADVYQYILSNLSPAAYESVTVKINKDNDLEISNTFYSTGTPDVTIKKESLTEQVILKVEDLSLEALDVQILDVKNWDNLADSSVELDNEAVSIEVKKNLSVPRISKVKPSRVKKSKLSKTERQNYQIIISGNNFQEKTAAKLGKKKAKSVVYQSKKKLLITVNLNKYKKGYYRLTIINPNKQKAYKLRALQIK